MRFSSTPYRRSPESPSSKNARSTLPAKPYGGKARQNPPGANGHATCSCGQCRTAGNLCGHGGRPTHERVPATCGFATRTGGQEVQHGVGISLAMILASRPPTEGREGNALYASRPVDVKQQLLVETLRGGGSHKGPQAMEQAPAMYYVEVVPFADCKGTRRQRDEQNTSTRAPTQARGTGLDNKSHQSCDRMQTHGR
jgi:hypothetical protein